jgi:P-type E1-E2 ATPase
MRKEWMPSRWIDLKPG